MSKIVRSIKNVANGYSSTQVLVRNATSNDPLGPTTYDMEMIAAATYNTQTEFLEIMDMLDRRLNDKGRNWRHVAKSLTVLDYLVRYGSDKCVLWLKDNLYIIKTLREFVHFDDAKNDQGNLIRVKAKELVWLLRDDERLATERHLARNGRFEWPERPRPLENRPLDPYDADLERALAMSKETAEREQQNRPLDNPDTDDPDLQAALKLSMEEEEMRLLRKQQNENLLDLDDNSAFQQQQQPQFYQQVQFVQPTQFFQPQQTFFQQYDMFGNPIQPTATGYPQNLNYGQFGQPQMQQNTAQVQPQIPQYTGFNTSVSANASEPEVLTPLKTGLNNPFALQSDAGRQSEPSQQQYQQPTESHFYTQPSLPQFNTQNEAVAQSQAQQRPQSQPQPSKYNDTHELNNLLASGTGLDTFGNTGATRIPHQHTKTGTFINSSGTGYNNAINDQRVNSNATRNPFLNTGMGPTANSNKQGQNSRISAAHTGYGFGNSKEEPSLIDT